VNTNGVRIAQDEAFAKRLATYMPGFELYLQFDSLEEAPLRQLRGADLREVRMKALERLNRHGISTTLVVTLRKGLNDHEVGRIVEFALQQPCVRGVTFQPVQDAGRNTDYDPSRDRLTLTETRRLILEQTKVFAPEDIVPVPCHPDSLAMAYALKAGGKVTPLTGLLDPQVLLEGRRNTIVFEKDEHVRKAVLGLFSTANGPVKAALKLRDLLCCLPFVKAPEAIGYQHLFRIIIMRFSDPHDMDVRSLKKSCVTIVHPKDLRLIPFDTYNVFYRDDLERTRLEPLRRAEEARWAVAAEAGTGPVGVPLPMGVRP
jgi:7,8-dihydro-6-hydroxymethylpterin dimethyltransferase